MAYRVNGVAGNSAFGDFEIEPILERDIRRMTNKFNQELRKKLLEKEKPLSKDFLIAFYEKRGRPGQPNRGDIDKRYFDLYDLDRKYLDLYEIEISSIYPSYIRLKYRHCPFLKKQKPFALDASKCRLNQVGAVVATVMDAVALSNKIKIAICIVVCTAPHLQNHLVKMFARLATWDVSGGTVDAFVEQLSREIDLVDNPDLSEFFRYFIRNLVPRLERRFLLYQGCEVGQRNCVLCVYNFINTPEPFTKDSFRFYCSIFRKRFYKSLVEFLTLVQSD